MQHIIKRKGHKETYDQKKIYKSVYAACMAMRLEDEQAESIAQMVAHETSELYKESSEIHRHDVHKTVVIILNKYHPEVSYLYDTHKELY